MTTSESVYGVHAVRVLLERHPERVVRVLIAERRGDARAKELAALAERAARPVDWVDARALERLVGDVVHQAVSYTHLTLPTIYSV